MSDALKMIYIIICSLAGGLIGAFLLGTYISLVMGIVGALIGIPIGALFGKCIPWYEWFT